MLGMRLGMVTLDARKLRRELIQQGASEDDAAAIVSEIGNPELMSVRLGGDAGRLTLKAYFSELGYRI